MTRLTKLVVANRGEIARRIMRTARDMGLATVAVYADSDADAPFAREADEAVPLRGATAAETYLDIGKLVAAAKRTGADAIHPGYGFLSENAAFARAVVDAGITWVGPAPDTIAAMGDKIAAKRLMTDAGVPTLPSVLVDDVSVDEAIARCAALGFPVLVKAAAGGGGKGMRVVTEKAALAAAIVSARREATAAFGDGRLFIEPYLRSPRHVEVQILGDGDGHLVHVFERECSIQRRHQKIVEEAPSPALSEAARVELTAAAVAAGRALRYVSAGTVEFMLDADGRFYFLEVNTRLQVEHPVTECITGLDLVREQLRVARGECLGLEQDGVRRRGHAIEVRLYAEDPASDFLPAAGRVLEWLEPAGGVRFDSGVERGTVVPVHFDPLLAKVIAHAPTRAEAAARLARALERLRVHGVTTNRDFLVDVLRHPAFLAGDTTTDFIERHRPAARRVHAEREWRLAALAAALHDEAVRRASRRLLATIPPAFRNNPSAMQETRYRAGEREIHVRYARERDGSYRYAIEGASGVVRVDHCKPSGGRGDDSHGNAARAHGDAGSRASADPGAAGRVDLVVDEVRTPVYLLAHGAHRFVHTPWGEVELVEVERFPRREREAAPGSQAAPTPGRVVEVAVAPGDIVARGQRLVVLEAMKMEHELLATSAGRVAEVRVQVGAQVDANDVLVVIEAASEPGEQ